MMNMMSDSGKCANSYVVSTSTRGIGLEFTRQLLGRAPADTKVFGLCRNPSAKLLDLQNQYPDKLEIISGVDLEKQETIERAATEISGKCEKIEILLNVAGILGDGSTVPGPERSVSGIDRQWFEQTMQVCNSLGTSDYIYQCETPK
jgi:NAD(P)-dependent dehydrogenase (short-subunit alcohol dehydrogenase family)